MRICSLFLIAAGLSVPFAGTAGEKSIETSYLSMRLPDYWNCSLQGAEWLCRDGRPNSTNKAVIVISAKEAAPEDSLTNYQKHLSQPRVRTERDGDARRSQVLQTTEKDLNGQRWIESLHLGSEIDNYYTRYLATATDRVGILVNFTVHKNFAATYGPEILQAIASLRVKTPPRPVQDVAQLSEPTADVTQKSSPFRWTSVLEPVAGNSLVILAVCTVLVGLALAFFIRKRF